MPSLQTSKSSPKPPMTSLAEIVQNDVVLQELHDSVEKELIETVSRWSLRVIVVLPGAAAILLYRDGQDIFINPFIVSLVAMIAGFFSLSIQWTVCFGTLTLLIVKHSLESGCSASLVPAIYGFIPCAFGFLFRTTKVVVMSTIMVLLATLYIVSIDLLDQCTSEPIASTQKMDILADRFMPLLTLILGNSIIIIAIVKQSRKSVLLHAKAAQSAAKLAHVRRDVLHRVTHELRTPLVGIVGSVELLTTSETMNDQDMENALTIKSSLERIVRICDDVLMAAKSKTDHSNDNVRKESVFSVASCVDDVVDIFGAAAAQKGIALKVDYRGDTQVMVRGMEVELRQVLLNLTGNAMKFTNTGSITIRVIQEDKSHFTDDGNVVRYRFEVQDTGIGIVAENASMLFEAFQQGEQNVVSRQHKGTGLGLTICKDFVERMGGEIRADGSQGKGSRFYFTLDLKKEEWAGEKEGVVVEKDSRRIRVVIADAEQESAATCHSVVSSIAPSALVKTVASVTDSLDAVIDSGDEKSSDIRVAFVDCDSIESTALVSTLLRLKDAGWLVFAHADHKGFSDLIEKSHDAYAVFRRPLPLIRIGGTLRHAINGVAPPLPKPSASQTKDGVDKKTAVNENLAPPKSLVDDHSVKVNDASQRSKRKAHRTASVELRPGSSVVVVDDTPVNVKVLVKMLSRATSVPIVSCFDGQSAVELVASSNREDLLLFLMD